MRLQRITCLASAMILFAAAFATIGYAQVGSPQQQGQRIAGPPGAGQPGGGQAGAGEQQAKPPFSISQEEFDVLWNVLKAWEQRSAQITTAKADFTLWAKDPVFEVNQRSLGKVSYKGPDHGMYKVLGANDEWTDHWACDGKSIFDFNYRDKVVSRFDIPPELQGKNIANGPLPFLFAAKADQLVNRYWMRLVTPQNKLQEEIWIEAYPRTQNERANFVRATIILKIDGLLPTDIELWHTWDQSLNEGQGGGKWSVHSFQWEINTENSGPLGVFKLFNQDEFEPKVPRGWKLLENPGQQNTGAIGAAQGGAIRN